MADLDGHLDRARRSRPPRSLPEPAAPGAPSANPLLALHQTVGNQAVQRQLRSGLLSRQVVAGLGPMLGNRAVQRLARPRVLTVAPTMSPPAPSFVAGGKNPGDSEEPVRREESPTAGGKGASDGDQVVHRAAIDAFQHQNPQGGLVARQRQLLGPTAGVAVEHQDRSPTLRRKGGGTGGGVAPSLTKKTVKGPTSQKYGQFSWTVQWELDNPSPKGGWIVQKVDAVHDIKKKDGTKAGTFFDKWVPYWEGWQVKKGQKITTYAQGGDVEDDTFSKSPSGADTQGTFEEIGSAAFYEGLKLPSGIKPNPKSPAGILPFTQADPGLTGGSTALAHSLKATWDGNGGDGTTTVTTV